MFPHPRSVFILFCLAALPLWAASHEPEIILADPRVRVEFGAQKVVLDQAQQPYLMSTARGTLVVQAGLAGVKPFPSGRITYPVAIGTVVSRDGGEHWSRLRPPPGQNGGFFEGGAIQLHDGTVLALDTFVTPGNRPNLDHGQRYTSQDDWRTLVGPETMSFYIPGLSFSNTTNDDGKQENAVRLHRRIVELPSGDLLTTFYGWMSGDTAPVSYMPSQSKTRVMLLRSHDRGRNWSYISTIAAGPEVDTEGYAEPALVRTSHGPHPGRLICQLRTGRELRETVSDDDGRTWSKPVPRVYADLDVYRTDKWVNQFRGIRVAAGAGGGADEKGGLIENNPTELIGAVVDPDLIELSSGVLAASFGIRVPPRACWPHAEFPWNGNYTAFSLDHGATWSTVIRLTSGILTGHYTGVAPLPGKNRLFVVYDYGDELTNPRRTIYGRTITLKTK